MNRQTPQSRKIGKILIFVMLIIDCYLLGICFSKISNEKDVYKIRVFDVITKNEIHEFKGYYYFFCGDNVADSKDSRYLGFVPEEFIVGVVNRISYSREYPDGNLRYNRIWVNPNR